jgi:transcriptional regulator with XRE-family HTH domain
LEKLGLSVIVVDVVTRNTNDDPGLKLTRHENQGAVDRIKAAIGERIRKFRGDISQEAVETESGVDRGIISKIEGGKTDYRIDSFLRVLMAVKGDEEILFGKNPLEDALHQQLNIILRGGIPSEIHYIMDALSRAVAVTNHATTRASPATGTNPPKSQRFA